MNEKKLKEALGAMLQYGSMWGHPKHTSRKDWDLLYEVYKELNNGADFVRDKTKKAK